METTYLVYCNIFIDDHCGCIVLMHRYVVGWVGGLLVS
jgi:hypothetical protein